MKTDSNLSSSLSSRLHSILKQFWGYDSFRPLQEDIIRSVVSGHDTLGLMPTGGGKSITFQVAGLFLNGLTIVVTPLISLMKDQVDNLKRRKIRAVAFHSGMTRHEHNLSLERLVNGNANFLYIAPERIANQRFLNELKQLNICQIVVDEAHCISQWGYDFRPSYLNIKKLREIAPDIPVLALTATATPEVTQDICEQLQFHNSQKFVKSFSRNNLSYIVRRSDTKIQDVFKILSRTQGSSIVYVRSRRRTREIAEYLTETGISATYYHAGLDYTLKEQRQNDWQNGNTRVIVATNAFGMGIDKPDVRVVIHFDIPPSLEEYYQEAGRAGRDGLPSYAVLLSSPTDKATLNRRLSQNFPPREFIAKTYERACIFMDLAVGEGYDTVHEFDIATFCKNFNLQPVQTRAALHLLEQAGYLNYEEEPQSRSRIMILISREELYYQNNLSESANQVLNALLRTYPGLFTDYVNISEIELSNITNINQQEVYQALLELAREKILSYVPRSRVPMIYVPTSREETRHIQIGRAIYENRIEIMRRRIDSIFDFVFNDSGCRVNRMLAYFGEVVEDDCSKCDVCRSRKKSKTSAKKESDLADRIYNFIATRPNGTTLPILLNAISENDKLTIDTLSFLLNEGMIHQRESLYFV